jgi:hypothetical protein
MDRFYEKHRLHLRRSLDAFYAGGTSIASDVGSVRLAA